MKEFVGKQKYVLPFTALITACGAAACVFSASNLPAARFDSGLPLLALLTIFLGSRLTMQLPRAKVHVSVSDTLIFLVLFVYGGEAAVPRRGGGSPLHLFQIQAPGDYDSV